jgi:hypothetical protein
MMGLSGTMKLVGSADIVRNFTGKIGFPASSLVPPEAISQLWLGDPTNRLEPQARHKPEENITHG